MSILIWLLCGVVFTGIGRKLANEKAPVWILLVLVFFGPITALLAAATAWEIFKAPNPFKWLTKEI